jgi:hypothetical protein
MSTHLFWKVWIAANASQSAMACRADFLPFFLSEVESLVLTFCTSSTCEQSYEGLQKIHYERHHRITLHSRKLGSSFMREVTQNGSPWADEQTTVRWKARTTFDLTGRNVYSAVNRNFDDHQNAGALRDSDPLAPTENRKQQFVPLNRLMDEQPGFLKTRSRMNLVSRTYHAVLYTLMRRFSGVLHVSDKAIVFDGKARSEAFDKVPVADVPKYVVVVSDLSSQGDNSPLISAVRFSQRKESHISSDLSPQKAG